MKKQISIKAISKKAFPVLLFAILSMTQSAYALPGTSVNKEPEITYKGVSDKKLMFNINFKNEAAQPLHLTIKNEAGEVIYATQFESKPLNKTIVFPEFPESGKLTFVMSAGKKEVAQTFQINAQVKTVEEFTVKGI